jgi:DNA-binding GntR family transcriptional regulator
VGIVGGSRQAVQQALVRMAREGLVTREAGKYALPKDIDSLAIQEGIDVVAGVDVVDSVSTSSIVNVGDLPL